MLRLTHAQENVMTLASTLLTILLKSKDLLEGGFDLSITKELTAQ